MHATLKKTFQQPLILSLIVITISFFIQSAAYINHDVGWHLIVAQKILAGEMLYKDIIEVNLPLIYYMRTISVMLAEHYNSLPYIIDTLLVNLLALFSFGLCSFITYRNNDSLLTRFLLLAANSFILFIIPLCMTANNIGQKEHLLLILTLPYFYLALFTSLQKHSIAFRTFIGLIAGVGFSIKPHFIVLLLATEFFLAVEKKTFFYWVRAETITLCTVGLTYLAIIALYFDDYFTYIVPLATTAYMKSDSSYAYMLAYPAIQQLSLIFQPALIPLGLIALRIFIRPTRDYIFFATLIFSSIILFVIQLKSWDYQLIPLLGFMVLALTYLLNSFIQYYFLTKDHKLSFKDSFDFLIILFLAASLGNIVTQVLPLTYNNTIANQDYNTDKLTETIQSYKGNGSTLILGKLPHTFPAVNYAEAPWPYNFSSLWLIDGIAHHTSLLESTSPELSVKQYFMNNLLNSLYDNMPALIIINTSDVIATQNGIPVTYDSFLIEQAGFSSYLEDNYTEIAPPTELKEKFIFFKRIENNL